MKVECPACGVQGVLQIRGSSRRIQHYVGFRDGKRFYEYHKIGKMEVNGSKNGSKTMEVKNCVLSSKLVRGVGFEPTNLYRTAASGLRLWPCLATPACGLRISTLTAQIKPCLPF